MRAPDPQRVELGAEVVGVAADRDVVVARLLRPAEPGHRDRHAAREGRHAQHQLAEVLHRAGVAVDEDDGLLRPRGAGLEDGRADAADGELSYAGGVGGGQGGRC